MLPSKHFSLSRLWLVAIVMLLLSSISPCAFALSTFTIEKNGNKFTVKRNDWSKPEKVRYRALGTEALSGKNFTASSGILEFGVNDKSLDVVVSEVSPSNFSNIPVRYRYQTKNSRDYVFQVLSMDGYDVLASSSRSISHGDAYKIDPDDLLDEHQVPVTNSELTITDAGYAQGYVPVPLDDYYSASAPKEYLDIMNCSVEILVEFDAREVDDGYQYVQFLVNETQNCDTGAGNGNPGNIDVSYFMAGFGHDPGDKNTNYAKYAFPVTSGYDDCGPITNCWSSYGNTIGKLYNQYFRNHSSFYQSWDGWFRVPFEELQTFGIRFNASGNNNDTWKLKNLVARMRVLESYGPKVMYDEIVVSPGPYNKGSTVYISVPFSEIAKVGSTTPKIQTSWGELNYYSGSGSNVMTFAGTITANPGTSLTINSKSGSIVDLASKTMVGDLTKDFSNLVVTEDYYLDNSWVTVTGLSSEPYVDDGLNHPGPVTVTYRGRQLTEGVDYTVSYIDNEGLQSGTKTAQVVITGIGKYGGTATAPFTIRATELTDFNQIESGVYEIATRTDLMRLSAYVTNGKHDCAGLTFRQTANINVGCEFLPIGGSSSTQSIFSGIYDGTGKTISGIVVDGAESKVGVFGEIAQGALVENLVIASSSFTGVEEVGPVVGHNGGTVTNCRVTDDVIVKTYDSHNSHQFFGGVVGFIYGGNVTGCYSAASFDAYVRVGGIVGGANGGLIGDCLYVGAVPNGLYVGQIYGRTVTTSPTFTNNYYTVNQTGAISGGDIDGARLARAITLGEHLAIAGDTTEYNVSGITALGDNVMLTGGTLYSGTSQTVTLAITPEAGYGVTSVTAVSGSTPVDVTLGEDNTCSFVMPEGDVTVSATFAIIGVPIDSINFPDANFRNYLLAENYGSDAVLTDEEIAGITQIYVTYNSISDLTGIEYFTALNTLYCDKNKLTSLDLSHNTALKTLYCEKNKLTSLDLSHNTALKTLYCYNNQLTTLDLSQNTALEYLQCYNNQLTVLDVSQSTALGYLSCDNNQLTALDVSHNTALTNLYCVNNQLTVLDVTNNTALKYLDCSSNQLTSLDVSNNAALNTLLCFSNQLTALDVSNNTALGTLYCYDNSIYAMNMDALVASLPTVAGGNGTFFVIDLDSETEQNVITTTQVTTARSKNWTVIGRSDGSWQEYDGSEPPTMPGDVNGDGEVTTVDVTAIYNYLLNGDETFIDTCDVDGDGFITTTDITVIYNILLGAK